VLDSHVFDVGPGDLCFTASITPNLTRRGGWSVNLCSFLTRSTISLPVQKGSCRKCFDSADWVLAHEGRAQLDLEDTEMVLPPKFGPSAVAVVPRRSSLLGNCEGNTKPVSP
jgi:hypothetical protein